MPQNSKEITFRPDFSLETVQQVGSDLICAQAAWVSTGVDVAALIQSLSPVDLEHRVKGLLKFLLSKRHGTPFETGLLTVRVEAPIFVWREWHRHRVGFSYNEESGRYKQLDPVFYIPGPVRAQHCMKPSDFKPSQPGYRGMLPEAFVDQHNKALMEDYTRAYQLYEKRLEMGYDNGLARICLPVAIYSSCFVTCNPRSLMSFLELRTDEESAARRSHPLWEMDQLARQLETVFKQHWPVTYKLWNENGRTAP